MQYTSTDELGHFEYHDAELVGMEWKDQCMIWTAKRINATVENSQNSHSTDMCVAQAEMVFVSAKIKSITFLEYSVYDHNNVLIRHEEPHEACPDEYASIFAEALSGYCFIYGMRLEKKPADGKHQYAATFTISAIADAFDVLLEFDRSAISWDAFEGQAWYKDSRWKKNRDK